MMIQDGDKVIVGPLDVAVILHDVTTGRYHAAFFEDHPLPGPVLAAEDVGLVRLKSKMHHTEGAPDLAGALVHLDAMVDKMVIPIENIWREPEPWDGQIGLVWVVPRWPQTTVSS